MNKELTKEEAEEFYNKLWLENKELIQENIDKTNTERFELELELVDKNKEIERLNKRVEDLKTINEEHQILNGMLRKENDRLNNIINEIEKYAGLGEINWEDKYQDIMLSGKGLLNRIKELKGSDK